MPHTRQWYKQEHIFPKVIDRDTYDYWVSLGKKSIADRASEEVEQLLKQNPHTPLDKEVLKELNKIMLADARDNGISSLPELKS